MDEGTGDVNCCKTEEESSPTLLKSISEDDQLKLLKKEKTSLKRLYVFRDVF